MLRRAPTLPSSARLAVLPEHCEAALRLLEARPAPLGELTEIILRDPGLLYALLAAAPLSGERLRNELRERVTTRLEILGPELLRAWLLQSLDSAHPHAAIARVAREALRVGECAIALAIESGYAYPDEAYLAGLLHKLGDLWTASHMSRRIESSVDIAESEARSAIASGDHIVDAGRIIGALTADCRFALPLQDALELQNALDEQVLIAHPLARLLWCARSLARGDWVSRTDAITRATGLSAAQLAAIRPGDALPEPSLSAVAEQEDISGMPALGSPPTQMRPRGFAGDALRDAALAGLVRAGLTGLSPQAIEDRFSMATRLLCHAAPQLVVIADDDEVLRPLALAREHALQKSYDELEQRLDDEASVIALAARTGTVTSHMRQNGAPGRSAHDWHVSRWLERDGLICIPLPISGTRGVAVVGVDADALPSPQTRRLMAELAGAAAQATLDLKRRRDEQRDFGAGIEKRFRDHARRIAHEATNPLTIIKSYLEMMPQRHPEASALGNELGILHTEIDRLARLLETVGAPPAESAEPAVCSVAQLLHDLRGLYGETLFAKRDIHFELRIAQGLPAVAMPCSQLKQVLLNLFRNAAEALQPGGRFSVVVPGQLITNGVPCLEIRVIDNGPGLPPERLGDLFTPRPSDKGSGHQGVGLSIVAELLETWHASILCRSQPGTGTSFQLLVPLANSG